MKYELKSISLWAFVKVAFVVNLLAGALGGFFVMPFFGMIMLSLESTGYGDPGPYGADESAFGAMVIVLPVLFGLGAAVVGTTVQSAAVLIYNLMARLMGGFEFNLQSVEGNVTPVKTAMSNSAPFQPPSRPNIPPPPRPTTPSPPSDTAPPPQANQSLPNRTENNE